jgi:hypothetical protein
VVPSVRLLREQDEVSHPAVVRFTLKIHREDRERALGVVHDVLERICPSRPRLTRDDRDIAALVRQFARAVQASDRIAAQLMEAFLCRDIQYLLERLLVRAKIDWAVKLWFDGLHGQDVKLVGPFEVEILGYIWIGDNQTQEPFEARLRASESGPGLEWFCARFGDCTRLIAEGVIRRDVAEDYPVEESTYKVRVGATVPRKDGQLVEWAFEFTKHGAGTAERDGKWGHSE